MRQTKLTSSLDNVWAHYKIVIGCVIDQFLKVFFVIIASSCILSTCSMSAWCHVLASYWCRSQHVAPRCTLCNSQRLLPRLPLPIPTPLKLALLAEAPTCSRLRPRSCCCCCRPAAVGCMSAERMADCTQKLQATVSATVES